MCDQESIIVTTGHIDYVHIGPSPCATSKQPIVAVSLSARIIINKNAITSYGSPSAKEQEVERERERKRERERDITGNYTERLLSS
jgi:hypothetical protein